MPLSVRLINSIRLAWSVLLASAIIGRFRPDVLFMTGGYVNAPVAVAARLRRVSAAIYLPDIEPGSAVKKLSRLVDRIACTAGESQAYFPAGKTVVTGYPVRPEFRQSVIMSKAEALAHFELQPEIETLLVFGGSRGARSINRAVMSMLPALLSRAQVIHVSGNLDWAEVSANADELPESLRANYRPYAYLHEEMSVAWRAADLLVSRAGAGMLGESPAMGTPAILVPYPYAWRYQKINADYLAERGAAIRLDDERLSEELLPIVNELLFDCERLTAMAAAARSLDVPDAPGKLADLLVMLGKDHA
jgi:UDP-N-acetylglucosamine--N-acetylmuramyl-(pentapeptide) pyrophosphoryl-undecaprenol N-acetylglucosamine transferase